MRQLSKRQLRAERDQVAACSTTAHPTAADYYDPFKTGQRAAFAALGRQPWRWTVPEAVGG